MLKKICSKEEAERLIGMMRQVEDVVLYEPVKKFVLAGGEVSDYYFDAKKPLLGLDTFRRSVAEIIAKHISADISFIATSGYGGIPLSTELSSLTHLSLVAVRAQEKQHGKGGWLDGIVPKAGEKGVVVDDVITKGGSIRNVVQRIGEVGAAITSGFVVVKRGNPELGFDVSYLFDVEDLLRR